MGSGNSISIKNDPSLPSIYNPYVKTNHAILEGNIVSSMMYTDLIKDIFIERDVNLILSIPLDNMENDTWF